MLEKLMITIPELTGSEERKLYIYTPDQEGPFPVLYMFDGQNLFEDEEASFGKSVVIPKGNEDLVAVVNEVIAQVLADGSYQAAYDEAVALAAQMGV